MNPIEGQIFIDLYAANKPGPGIKLTSTRPLHAQKILVGKTPEQALSIIPMLYNICGTAHSHAALSVIQQCLRCELNQHLEIARDVLLQVEICKEHLMRVFLDWPGLFRIDPGKQPVSFLSQLTAEFSSALFKQGNAFSLDSSIDIKSRKLENLVENLESFIQTQVFSMPTSEWLCLKPENILDWASESNTIAAQTVNQIYLNNWESRGKLDCQHLPDLGAAQLLLEFEANPVTFISQPQWQNQCFETTALSRYKDHPLVASFYQKYKGALITRWLARLVELASIPHLINEMLERLKSNRLENPLLSGNHVGLAQIETARGRLIHHAEIQNGKFSNYQILAPTEWNFHPKGVITQSLASMNINDSQFIQMAHLIINAVDPCVGYKLRLH